MVHICLPHNAFCIFSNFMDKEKAVSLLHGEIKNNNLRKHCYAVAAVMKKLADHFNEDKDLWEITGLVHDIDYEKYPKKHPLVGLEILKKENYSKEIIDAVAAHAWGYCDGMPEPKNNLEWSLYCCDELTGLIVACALVRPDKKLCSVDVASIQKKWNQKAFAAGVNRSQIQKCEEKLKINLEEFIKIALTSMQEIHASLGL